MANREQKLRAELGLFQRGRTWYCHVWEIDAAGERHRVQRSTRCTDLEAAATVARQLQRDAADPAHATARAATLSGAIGAYLEHFRALVAVGKRSAATIDFYTYALGHWTRILEGEDEATYKPFRLATLTPRHVLEFIQRRREEGAGENTIGKAVVALLTVLKLAKRREDWKGDTDALVPPSFLPEYKPRERWLPRAEVQALLAALLPDRAARMALAVATGANKSEAAKVRREDVDLEAGVVLLRGTKTEARWRRVVVAMPWQRDLLEYALRHGEGEGGLLFRPWTSQWRDVHEACESAGIAPVSSNDWRRTFSHWCRAEGLSLETIAPLMGHTTTQMVQKVYGKRDVEELRARMVAELGSDCITGASDPPESAGIAGAKRAKTTGNAQGGASKKERATGYGTQRAVARLWPNPRRLAPRGWRPASRVHQDQVRRLDVAVGPWGRR
jgi:integrase